MVLQEVRHREAVRRFRSWAYRRHLHPLDVAPPVFRLLWAMGVRVRPPHFIPRFRLAVFTGAGFAVGMAALCALFFYLVNLLPMTQGADMPWLFVAVGPSAAGVIFGALLSHHYASAAKRLQLPDWNHFLLDPPTEAILAPFEDSVLEQIRELLRLRR